MTTDPFGAAIEAAMTRALTRAIAAQFQTIEDKLTARIDGRLKAIVRPAELPPVADTGERIVSTADAATMLGVHKTTLLRYEGRGLLPKRFEMPGGRTGFKLSELREFIDKLPTASGEVVVSNPSKVRKGEKA